MAAKKIAAAQVVFWRHHRAIGLLALQTKNNQNAKGFLQKLYVEL